jgi:hypothetical protein
MEKRGDWKRRISLLEIFLLVLSTVAFSYIMYQGSGLVEEANRVQEEAREIQKDYSVGKITLETAKQLLKKLREPIIPTASAMAEESFKCCQKTVNNSVCQDVLDTARCQQNLQIAPTDCQKTSFCKRGCCENTDQGTFDRGVPQVLCTGPDAKWHDDPNCNIREAAFGCCVLGSRTLFTTQKQCDWQVRSGNGNGSTMDWRGNYNEAQCVALSMIQEEGACLTGNQGCKFITKQECISLTGSGSRFFPNYLCTAPQLNSTCTKTEDTKCFTGKDEVYFVDSCGNRANIYDSSRVNDANYWSRVFQKNESCGNNAVKWNANSPTCGNCFRFGEGSICASKNSSNIKPAFGNNFCRDTSCTYKGQTYKNGESWCVYDGAIGNGDDVVGSRHWKYVCNQGEVQVEPCADFRNQICIQSNTFEVNGTNVSFKNANCIANNWRECIDLNSQKGNVTQCEKKLNCRLERVNIADKFHFEICTPKYPGGFAFANEGEQKAAEQICGMATQTCTVMYKQTFTGGCECVANCDCEKIEFTQKMNDFCRKLGDCGAEVNIEGGCSQSYAVKGAPRLSPADIARLVRLSKPVPGQYAEVENYTEFLEAAGLLGPNIVTPQQPKEKGLNLMGAGLGIAGVGYALGMQAPLSMTIGVQSFAEVLGLNPAFGSAMIAAGIGFTVGTMLAKMTGASPMGSLVAGLAGLVAGVAAYAAGGGALFGGGGFILGDICLSIGAACVIMIIAIIIMIVASLFGGSKCKPKKVTFTCEPWQPQPGGAECGKCNGDPLKPCSEYRCESLGAACKLINPGTTEEICVEDNARDVNPPMITPNPQFNNLTNTTFSNVSGNGFSVTGPEGGCVDAYTNLVWGVNTDEPAQCRFDLQMQDKFEELGYALGSNAYVYNHTTAFMLPDPSHGQSQGINYTGDVRFYIKCRDTHGKETLGFYSVGMCVNQGEDKTPPRITYTEPENSTMVSYFATQQNASIYTNEPSDCRWSLNDTEYPNMENRLNCTHDIEDSSTYGYECSGNLPITGTTNQFYIRCMDQPWLEEVNRSSERNANTQSTIYQINKPASPISINATAPSGDFEIFNLPTTGKLRVLTSGGGQYPKCSYRVAGYSLIQMQTTFQPIHEQEIPWFPGFYNIYVECEDETGDSANTTIQFEIFQDSTAPVVSRIFRNGNSIKFTTSENGDCRYSSNIDSGCAFSFNSSSSAGSGTEHSISSKNGQIYFIKCKDGFGNTPDGCSAVISPAI